MKKIQVSKQNGNERSESQSALNLSNQFSETNPQVKSKGKLEKTINIEHMEKNDQNRIDSYNMMSKSLDPDFAHMVKYERKFN